MKNVMMEEMTWTEIENAMKDGCDTVMFSVGSVEQHGPHLPLGTDWWIGDVIAKRAAEKLGNALVAPTIRPGFSIFHEAFPGSLSLKPETLTETINDYCRSLARFFKNIVIIGSHGGNFPIIETASAVISEELGGRNNIMTVTNPFYDPAKEKWVMDVDKGGTHAGRFETSMILAEKPSTVHMERAVESWPEMPEYKDQALGYVVKAHRMTKIGVFGDPRGANAEEGKQLIEAFADNIINIMNGYKKFYR